MIAVGQVQEVAELLRSGQALIPFVIEMMAKSYDLNNPREKEVAFGSVRVYLDSLSPIIREAYIAHASTVLGVNAALFGGSAKLENTKARFQEGSRDDVGQLSIIKTLMENEKLVNKVANVIEPSMFGKYASLLESVIKGESNSSLSGLSVDENIIVMSEEELSRSLSSFLFRYYSTRLKSITTDSEIPLKKKSFLIRKIKTDILPRLRRGELVTYEF